MSLEVLKTELEPPLACGLGSGFAEHVGQWRLGRILFNHDGRVHRDLRAANVPHYMPWCRVTYLDLLGRCQTRPAPLFPGYAFVVVGVSEIPKIRGFHLDPIPDQFRLVEDLVRLESLRRLGVPVEAEPQPAVGDLVTLRGGQLAGLSGVVLECRGKRRLIVQVHTLGRGVSVELPPWRVTKATQESSRREPVSRVPADRGR